MTCTRSGVLSLALLALLGACTGCDSAHSRDDGAQSAAGGMDGAGNIVTGFLWDTGVVVQIVWDGPDFRYVVSNQLSRDVEVVVAPTRCTDVVAGSPDDVDAMPPGCVDGEPLGAPWHIPAESTRMFDVASLPYVSEPYQLYRFSFPDGTFLGHLSEPRAEQPVAELPVVSDFGLNENDPNWFAQVETDFVTAPGPTFALTVSLAKGGELQLPRQAAPRGTVEFVTVADVRCEACALRSNADNFYVDVPMDASETSRVRVHIDVEVPPAASGRSVIGFTSAMYYGSSEDAGSGPAGGARGRSESIISRAFPLRD